MHRAYRPLYSIVYLEVYMYLYRIETFVRAEDISDPWIFRYSEVLPKKTVPVVPHYILRPRDVRSSSAWATGVLTVKWPHEFTFACDCHSFISGNIPSYYCAQYCFLPFIWNGFFTASKFESKVFGFCAGEDTCTGLLGCVTELYSPCLPLPAEDGTECPSWTLQVIYRSTYCP